MQRTFNAFIIAAVCLILAGCANMMTNTSQYKESEKLLLSRDVSAIISKIEKEKGKTYKEKDRVLEYLDLGMLYHYQGDYVKSNLLLEQAEQAMEELYTKSIAKAALSMLLNDNALDYFGEDYEDIYTNVFKALNFMHQNKFDEAFVEIRRIDMKLNLLEDKYGRYADGLNTFKDKKSEFHAGSNVFTSSALGRYLSMIIYTHEGQRDNAYIDYNKISESFASQPNIYNFSKPDMVDPLHQLTHPVLHIFALTGKSPSKNAQELHIHTSKNMLSIVGVDKTVSPHFISWPGIDPDYYFKFSLPYIVNHDTEVQRVVVRIDNKSFQMQKLEDIGNVAYQTYKTKEPIIYLKSITRSLLKGIAAEMAKKRMKEKNPGFTGSLMGLATDVALFASENADLRISRFFPDEVLIAEIPLPEGEYNISIDYYHRNGSLLYSDDKGKVTVNPNKLNLVESWHLQ